MRESGIHIQELPSVENPILIAAFDGWGNAMDVATEMVAYLIGKLKAKLFAQLNPDYFYRYDDPRPVVRIEEGTLKGLSTPGGSFYVCHTGSVDSDIVFLRADEPT